MLSSTFAIVSVCPSLFVVKYVESTMACCPSAVFLSFSRKAKSTPSPTHLGSKITYHQPLSSPLPLPLFIFHSHLYAQRKRNKIHSVSLCYFYRSLIRHTRAYSFLIHAERQYERGREVGATRDWARHTLCVLVCVVPNCLDLVGPNREMRCANPNLIDIIMGWKEA